MCGLTHLGNVKLNESRLKPDFDLDKEFDDANRMYFDGELKPIPMEFTKMTKSFGRVQGMVTRNGRTKRITNVNLKVLQISDMYEYTREQFLSTFLHELCHLYMFQNFTQFTFTGGYHGREWKRLADRVSQASNIPITVDEEASGYKELNSSNVKNPEIAVVFIARDGKKFNDIAFTTMTMWRVNGYDWIKVLEQVYRNAPNLNIEVYRTTSTRPSSFARKSVKRFISYVLPDGEYENMMDSQEFEELLYKS